MRYMIGYLSQFAVSILVLGVSPPAAAQQSLKPTAKETTLAKQLIERHGQTKANAIVREAIKLTGGISARREAAPARPPFSTRPRLVPHRRWRLNWGASWPFLPAIDACGGHRGSPSHRTSSPIRREWLYALRPPKAGTTPQGNATTADWQRTPSRRCRATTAERNQTDCTYNL